jgi:hypothetical protein
VAAGPLQRTHRAEPLRRTQLRRRNPVAVPTDAQHDSLRRRRPLATRAAVLMRSQHPAPSGVAGGYPVRWASPTKPSACISSLPSASLGAGFARISWALRPVGARRVCTAHQLNSPQGNDRSGYLTAVVIHWNRDCRSGEEIKVKRG